MSNWRKGNAYTFHVFEKCDGFLVSNVHYQIMLRSEAEANIVAKVLNDVQIGNGDGTSKKELKYKLGRMKNDYLKHEGITLSEKILVTQIFRSVGELINERI